VNALFERVAVIGLGLLGGSAALAAKQRGVARSVWGSGRRSEALADAVARGIVDGVGRPEEIASSADLVILATPVGAMAASLQAIAPQLRPGCLVTDVGSVKTSLAETLPGLVPAGSTYVGSHPMAGSHLRGVEHADAELFCGTTCAVCPHAGASLAAVERVSAFWRALGAQVVEIDPVEHDASAAWISHLPHALAYVYAQALAGAPQRAGKLIGPGFRDFTRIARSDPKLWSEILTENHKALAGPLAAAAAALTQLLRSIEADDREAVEAVIAEGRDQLVRLTGRAAAETQATGGPQRKMAPESEIRKSTE